MPLVLAGLPAAAAGIMALILIFGVVLLVDALLRSIDVASIPGLIGDMFRAVARAITWAVQAIGSFLAMLARPFISVFVAPAAGFANFANSVLTGFARVASWTRWLAYTAVPQLWTGIFSSIANVVANLTAFAARLFEQAMAALNSVRAYLERLISTTVAVAMGYALSLSRVLMVSLNVAVANLSYYARSLFNAAMATLAATTASLTAYILATRAQLVNYVQQLTQWGIATAIGISIDWARKYADWIIDTYQKAIAGGTAIAMAPAWPATIDAIDSISLALPDSIAATLARIGAIPRAIPRDLALEIGAVAAVGSVAVDWVARCGLSLCRNTKGFGDELAALGDAALIAELIELIISARNDPNGAAQGVAAEIAAPLMELGDNFGDIMLAAI